MTEIDRLIERYCKTSADLLHDVLIAATESGNWHTVEELAEMTGISSKSFSNLLYQIIKGRPGLRIASRKREKVSEYQLQRKYS